MAPGWFNTFQKQADGRTFLRFMWPCSRKKQLVYLGSLGPEPECPTAMLDAIVSKVMRMNGKQESPEQQEKHLEMLFRLRDMDKSWEAWEQRWNGG